MSARTYGILAGVLGSALGAWWLARRRGHTSGMEGDRGVTIYRNTPTPSPISAEGII